MIVTPIAAEHINSRVGRIHKALGEELASRGHQLSNTLVDGLGIRLEVAMSLRSDDHHTIVIRFGGNLPDNKRQQRYQEPDRGFNITLIVNHILKFVDEHRDYYKKKAKNEAYRIAIDKMIRELNKKYENIEIWRYNNSGSHEICIALRKKVPPAVLESMVANIDHEMIYEQETSTETEATSPTAI